MEVNQSGNNLQQLRRNLLAGLRLATGRRVAAEDFSITFNQGLWLLLSLIGLELLIGYLTTDSPAFFYRDGLNYLGAIYLFDLAVILLIAHLVGAGMRQTGGMLIAILAVTPSYLIVAQLLHLFREATGFGTILTWVLWLLPITWQVYILFRLLRVFLAIRVGRGFIFAVVYVALGFLSLWFLPRSELWYTMPSDPSTGPYAKLYQMSVEDLFYDQPPLMESSLEGLAEQRPGVSDLYLLAVGGYGLEKVFLNEVEYVRTMFDERFDTRERSMILVNNVDTLQRYPLANGHNLRAALGAIGQRLDPDEDVVFLFMTSHGSKSHRFSVQFGPIPLDDLTPEQVREALDEAGIRWRIILISSCYSGGFIESLKDPNTLIITAAAPDRKSFGCGADSEFTDFGTAYFKHALVQQQDFIAAFDTAATWISEKEQREQREASQPQRYIGEAIREKVFALNQQFEDFNRVTRDLGGPGACENEGREELCQP